MENDNNIYETDERVWLYCDFQYGIDNLSVDNFAVTCVDKAMSFCKEVKKERALEIGCAVGRASFELARRFGCVDGIDYSAYFIDVAKKLQLSETVSFMRQGEGELTQLQQVNLAQFGLEQVVDKVTFSLGDACKLDAKFSQYDLVLATNLIDRLYKPVDFLDQAKFLVRGGGYLVLTSPYTWLEEFTAKENWLGGFKNEAGENVKTIDSLERILAEHFEFVATEDIPFVIRHSPRRFQYTIAQMSVWRRKE